MDLMHCITCHSFHWSQSLGIIDTFIRNDTTIYISFLTQGVEKISWETASLNAADRYFSRSFLSVLYITMNRWFAAGVATIPCIVSGKSYITFLRYSIIINLTSDIPINKVPWWGNNASFLGTPSRESHKSPSFTILSLVLPSFQPVIYWGCWRVMVCSFASHSS